MFFRQIIWAEFGYCSLSETDLLGKMYLFDVDGHLFKVDLLYSSL